MTKPKKVEDPLYKGMPSHVQAVWTEHKKHKRARERKEFKQRLDAGK